MFFLNKKKIIILFVVIIVLGVSLVIYVREEKNNTIVIEEDYSKCEEFDITNKELEEYFNSIESEEKQELLRKIFYYPSDLLEKSPVDENLDVMEKAKIMASFPIEKLRDIVDEMESNILKLDKNE